MYKFENLEVWQLSLEYSDMIYKLANQLPKIEEFNLKSQIIRATTSISLNIAEGSTGKTDAEQNRFIGMALRSLIETVACQRLIQRRGYIEDREVEKAYDFSEKLFAKLNAFRKAVGGRSSSVIFRANSAVGGRSSSVIDQQQTNKTNRTNVTD